MTDYDATHPTLNLHHPGVTVSDALFAGEQVAQRLRSLSDSLPPNLQWGLSRTAAEHYRRVRVKTYESIREKVRRKRSGSHDQAADPLYSFRDILDIVGFRIVTLYDDELSLAMNYVLTLVQAGQQFARPLFGSGAIWENFAGAKFFARVPESEHDVYRGLRKSLEERIQADLPGPTGLNPDQLTKRVEERVDIEQKYSSAHLVFDAISYGRNSNLLVPVEFQIRTAVEDIWAEINHKLLYKIESPYVWNRKFGAEYENATSSSNRLKEQLGSLPPLIAAFRHHSTLAQEQINSFTNPDVDHDFSLVISLFLSIDSDCPPRVRAYLREYEAIAADSLPKSARTGRGPFLILDAMGAIDSIAAALNVEVKQLEDTDVTPGPLSERNRKIEVAKQRILLCHLEKIRLRILLITRFKHDLKLPATAVKPLGRNPTVAKLETERTIQRHCVAVYKELCQFRDHKLLQVRPIAVIFYWKYWVAQYFDVNTARTNILNAYEELQFDRSVPSWSVYRGLIPRELANNILGSVTETTETLKELGGIAANMHGLASDLKAKLTDAMGYALKAFAFNKEQDVKRGDLIFGFAEGSPAMDAELVLSIYLFYKLNFGELITESRQVSLYDVDRAYDYLKELYDKRGIPDERDFDVRTKLNEFEKLMEARVQTATLKEMVT